MHGAQKYPDQASARAASRRIRTFRTQVRRCDGCDGWHVVAYRTGFDDTDMYVLRKMALGLRDHEIGTEIGENQHQVCRRIRNFINHFDALSRAHLIAISIAFGLIDASSIALSDERKESNG